VGTCNCRPVVFIHGFGASMYGWRYQLPVVVAAGYRVVVIDNRGFGFSDKPAHGYTSAAYAHLIVSLLDSLGIASAVLVGHSMGGAIAAEVALAHPDRGPGTGRRAGADADPLGRPRPVDSAPGRQQVRGGAAAERTRAPVTLGARRSGGIPRSGESLPAGLPEGRPVAHSGKRRTTLAFINQTVDDIGTCRLN